MKASLFMLSLLFSLPCFANPYPVVVKGTPFEGSRLYVPNDGKPHHSILMLHGSEGGSEPFIDMEANVLATQGYTTLVLCYFDCTRGITGPRETLKNVEATKVLDGVAWLRKQPESDQTVAVYGFSRGGELTMIVGSLAVTKENRPDALIAHTPSDVFNSAWNWSWQDKACWICRAGLDKCTASSPDSDYEWNPGCGPDDPTKMDYTKSAWLVSGVNIPAETRIEVEKYDGPILITVGEKDQMWPVDQTPRIEAPLKAAGRNPEVHYFPNGGHSFFGDDEIQRRELVLGFLGKLSSQRKK
ncbi:MAG: alpha/beta hydrolase family protein [Bdellovibrionota bacterium]